MSQHCLRSSAAEGQVRANPVTMEDATSLVIRASCQILERVLEQRGHTRPPFLPEEFASLLGIRKIVRSDLGETSAVLLKSEDGYVIKVNQNHHPVRRNFSCAHEIGHALLSELNLEPTEDIEFRTFNPQAHAIARARAIEHLCDVAATELLMPEPVFKKYLSGFGVSVHSIERLANVFRVSFQTVAIRIAEISEEACVALMWHPWPKSMPKGLRLSWCAGPGRTPWRRHLCAPLNTFVRHTSALYKAYQDDSPVKSYRLFKIDGAIRRLPTESKGFGTSQSRYVLSLAFPQR